MATQQMAAVPTKTSSDAEVPGENENLAEKDAGHGSQCHFTKDEASANNIQYPEPWKYKKFFVGGYSQSRMLKFKKPKSMYTAINLFAGEAFCFTADDPTNSEKTNEP